MSEKKVKRCPKCGGEMEQGQFSQAHVMRHRFLCMHALRVLS